MAASNIGFKRQQASIRARSHAVIRRLASILVFAWGAVLAAPVAAEQSSPSAPPLVIETTHGPVRGLSPEPGMRAFRSIPYAGPTGGENRWRAPTEPKPWTDVLPVVEFGPKCPQLPVYKSMVDDQPMSEDCLNLNVWTPADRADEKLPVMVWIHGGSYIAGSGANYFDWQDGATLARKGVVLVSFNYRLGALGFLAHPDLQAETANHTAGNYGMMDAVMALKWVQADISRFGGDPANVTIFGQSAGAEMVTILMASPDAKGLFRRGISESGGSIGWREPTAMAAAAGQGKLWGDTLGAPTIAQLRALPVEKVVSGTPGFGPVAGDALYPRRLRDYLHEGKPLHGAWIAGSNANEFPAEPKLTLAEWQARARNFYGADAEKYWAIFPARDDESVRQVAASEGTALADYAMSTIAIGAAKNALEQPVFQYRFNHAPPPPVDPESGLGNGAYHGAEVSYVFDALSTQPGRAWTAADRNLANIMSAYWVNFARTGNPNGPGLPDWTSLQQAGGDVLIVDDLPAMGNRPNRDVIPELDSFFYGDAGVYETERDR